MSDAPESTEVTVEVTPAETPPEPATGDTTVVVSDGGNSGIHPSIAEFMATQAAFNERLLATMENTTAVADDAAITAGTAATVIDGAVAEVQEVASQVSATIAENAEPVTAENDIPPKHSEHRWYR